MAKTNTTELNLIKPTPGTKEPYTVANDNTNMDTIDALFNSTSGHDHSAAHKGKPIPASGLAQPLTLTSPHFTSPVVDSGGLTVTAGTTALTTLTTSGTATIHDLTVSSGLTVTAGGLTVSAGGVNVTGNSTFNSNLTVVGSLLHTGTQVGFYNHAATSQNTVTGSKGANAALTNLLIALNSTGLIVDSTT